MHSTICQTSTGRVRNLGCGKLINRRTVHVRSSRKSKECINNMEQPTRDLDSTCCQRRVLHFFSSLILSSHSRDFSLSVQNVILDNLGSLHCCRSYVIVDERSHWQCWLIFTLFILNWIWQFSYDLFLYLLSSKSMTNMIQNKVHIKISQTIMPHPLNMSYKQVGGASTGKTRNCLTISQSGLRFLKCKTPFPLRIFEKLWGKKVQNTSQVADCDWRWSTVHGSTTIRDGNNNIHELCKHGH